MIQRRAAFVEELGVAKVVGVEVLAVVDFDPGVELVIEALSEQDIASDGGELGVGEDDS